ncbi:MAG: hypothetical protein HYW22_01335 [Candidatus Aenigmarchaeota archaeon]|nr:hypothetical protein [Candidatus Aenigmarchaeota archaeon]
MDKKFTCPCCGYETLPGPLGCEDICKICFWQDDLGDYITANRPVGPNRVSLIEAQKNFIKFGASDKRILSSVRKPTSEDKKDPEWRMVDLSVDVEFLKLYDHWKKWPDDTTKLYYWKQKLQKTK